MVHPTVELDLGNRTVHVGYWPGYGRRPRLYVRLPGGPQIGYWCFTDGTPVVEAHDPAIDHRSLVTDAATAWEEARRTGTRLPPVENPPAPTEGQVSDDDAAAAGARDTGGLTVGPTLDPQVLLEPVPLPAPQDDLARNAPGHSLALRIAEDRRRSRLRTLWSDLTGAARRDSWRVGLRGEQRVGAVLGGLCRDDPRWRVIHSVPDPVRGYNPDKDIDHLVIGPTGVFAINTKHYPGRDIRVGDTHAWSEGEGRLLPDRARREAGRATRLLTVATGIPVVVHPMLVFVRPRSVTMVATQPEEAVPALTPDRLVERLQDWPGRIAEFDVDAIYARARHLSTWVVPATTSAPPA